MKRIASALATLVLGMSLAHAASTEQAFVTQAAQGGLAEVELGQLALARGASRAVKAFAQTMVEDHRKANADLEKVAAAAGASVPTEPSTAHKAVADRLGSLSGNEFDVAYSTQMVADHEKKPLRCSSRKPHRAPTQTSRRSRRAHCPRCARISSTRRGFRAAMAGLPHASEKLGAFAATAGSAGSAGMEAWVGIEPAYADLQSAA